MDNSTLGIPRRTSLGKSLLGDTAVADAAESSNGLFFVATNMQRELKSCAGTVVVRYRPEPATVILNNRAADLQPHTHSPRLGGVESIENLFEVLSIEPNAGVLHGHEQLVGFVLTGSNTHLPRSIRDSIHRFDTVHHQIKNH